MAGRSKQPANQSFLRFCFVAYCFFMLWLLFGLRWGTEIYTQQLAESVNLKPMATISRYMDILRNTQNPALFRHAVINLVGNVIMFIPLGIFLPVIWRKCRGFIRLFLLAGLLIAAVEAVQYLTALGTCDVDDFLLNMAGVCLGYFSYKIKHH